MSEITSIAVVGANGRMGRSVITACLNPTLACRVACTIDSDHLEIQVDSRIDCVIDFSSSHGAVRAAQLAIDAGAALLCCTTGLDQEARGALSEASKNICVMWAPNTSLGVAVARRLCQDAAAMLGADYSVDVIEHHHQRKLDAPSGTALALAEAVQRGSGTVVPPDRIHSIRAGETIGDHSVQFVGPFETLRIEHSAVSRELFAVGALRLARWLRGRSPGRVTLDDWLDARSAQRSSTPQGVRQ